MPDFGPAADQADQLRELVRQTSGESALTVAVVSGKGGVGKTNLAVNVSICLSARGQRTILLDGDLGLANADLLMNVPPGCMKSYLVSVFWPAWEWIQYPEYRYLCGSYDEGLSIRDNRRSRDVIKSDLYQRHWWVKAPLAATSHTSSRTHLRPARDNFFFRVTSPNPRVFVRSMRSR